MGTSTRNKGQSGHNPLIPTWLDGELITPSSEQTVNQEQPIITSPLHPIPQNADSNRFKGARGAFSHFVSSRGHNGDSLKRSISSYVRHSIGGSSNALKRLGSSRISTTHLYNVLNMLFQTDGLQQISRSYSLGTLEGLSAENFFIRLSEFICPDGGTEGEGVSRSAYYDTIVENPEMMEKPIESLRKEEIDLIFQCYMSKVIMQQIMNGIANNIIHLPDTLEDVFHLEDIVEQLIDQSVSDACAQVEYDNAEMTEELAREITDRIYHKVFEILEEAGS